jgi:DNA-binding response OmpR family regulator
MKLLLCLHRHLGRAVTREQLFDEVWGTHYQGTTRTLDQTMLQLRKKLGESGLIHTLHGVGYRLDG